MILIVSDLFCILQATQGQRVGDCYEQCPVCAQDGHAPKPAKYNSLDEDSLCLACDVQRGGKVFQ